MINLPHLAPPCPTYAPPAGSASPHVSPAAPPHLLWGGGVGWGAYLQPGQASKPLTFLPHLSAPPNSTKEQTR